jgi:hypothetical protein
VFHARARSCVPSVEPDAAPRAGRVGARVLLAGACVRLCLFRIGIACRTVYVANIPRYSLPDSRNACCAAVQEPARRLPGRALGHHRLERRGGAVLRSDEGEEVMAVPRAPARARGTSVSNASARLTRLRRARLLRGLNAAV